MIHLIQGKCHSTFHGYTDWVTIWKSASDHHKLDSKIRSLQTKEMSFGSAQCCVIYISLNLRLRASGLWNSLRSQHPRRTSCYHTVVFTVFSTNGKLLASTSHKNLRAVR